MFASLVAFVGVAAVVICTPGPDTALTIRSTLGGGRRHGILTAAGVVSGQLVWTIAAAVGIAGLIQASRPAFEALKIAGAVYLVALGAHSVWSAWRTRDVRHDDVDPTPRSSGRRAFVVGVLNDLANPKIAVFFLSLLPQFAPGGRVVGFLLFGALFGLLTFLWLAVYAVLFDRLRRVFSRRAFRRWLDTVGGAVLVGLGVRVAAEH